MKLKSWWAAGAVFAAGMVAWGGEVDLRKLGGCSLGGPESTVHTLTVSGGRAYACRDTAGLFIVDLADPSQPSLLGQYTCPDGALGVSVDGNTAYVGSGSAGLLVLDVSDPSNPKKLGGMDTKDMAFRSCLRGRTLFLADRSSGLWIFDVSNPAEPLKLGEKSVGDYVFDVKVAGDYAYLAGDHGLWVLNVSQLAAPEILTNVVSPGQGLHSLTVRDGVVFAGGTAGTLFAFDVSDPSNPKLTSQSPWAAQAAVFTVAAMRGEVIAGWSNGGFRVLDQSQSSALAVVASVEGFNTSVAVAATDSLAVVGDRKGVLAVYGYGPTALSSSHMGGLGTSTARTLVAADKGAFHVAQASKLVTWARTNETAPSPSATNGVPFTMRRFPTVMAVANGLGVLAGDSAKLLTFDLDEPAAPKPLGSVGLPGSGNAIACDGLRAAVASDGSLSVVDVGNPATPAVADTLPSSLILMGVSLAGTHLYAGSRVGLAPLSDVPMLQSYLLGESNKLTLISEQVAQSSIYGLATWGDRLCAIQTAPISVSVYSIANPDVPALLGSYVGVANYNQMVLRDGYLYARIPGAGFDILDVRDPRNIRRVGGNSLPIQALVTDGTLLYANTATDLYFFQPLVPPSESRLTPLGAMEGRFRFLLEGEAGQSVEVQRAATLGDWLPWQILTLETNKLAVEDVLNPEQAAGFYRVLQK